MKDAVEMVIEAAVCMANGGGGTVVFGVNDKVMGLAGAVLKAGRPSGLVATGDLPWVGKGRLFFSCRKRHVSKCSRPLWQGDLVVALDAIVEDVDFR